MFVSGNWGTKRQFVIDMTFLNIGLNKKPGFMNGFTIRDTKNFTKNVKFRRSESISGKY